MKVNAPIYLHDTYSLRFSLQMKGNPRCSGSAYLLSCHLSSLWISYWQGPACSSNSFLVFTFDALLIMNNYTSFQTNFPFGIVLLVTLHSSMPSALVLHHCMPLRLWSSILSLKCLYINIWIYVHVDARGQPQIYQLLTSLLGSLLQYVCPASFQGFSCLYLSSPYIHKLWFPALCVF